MSEVAPLDQALPSDQTPPPVGGIELPCVAWPPSAA